MSIAKRISTYKYFTAHNPTEEFYNSFEEGDSRRDATVLDIEAFAAATGSSYTEGYDHTGYFNNKYIPRAGESGGQTELNYLTNFRIIRYEESKSIYCWST